MQVHRVEVAKVLKDRKYDWYLFLEDDANFKLEHFDALLKAWLPLQRTAYIPGLIRYSLPECVANVHCCRDCDGHRAADGISLLPEATGKNRMDILIGKDNSCLSHSTRQMQRIADKFKFLVDLHTSVTPTERVNVVDDVVQIGGQW